MVSESHKNDASTSTSSPLPTLPPTESQICAVVLVDERISSKNANASSQSQHVDHKNCVLLGTVILEKDPSRGDDIRNFIATQLPNVPREFIFLSKEGWPISEAQEKQLLSRNIINERGSICIQKVFDKPRVGVINTNGEYHGFVFADHGDSLVVLREVIDELLKDSNLKYTKCEYKFIERNGWPVTLVQEAKLSLLDIIINQNICIQTQRTQLGSHESGVTITQIEDKPAITSVEETVTSTYSTAIVKSSQDVVDSADISKSKSKKSVSMSRKSTRRSKGDKIRWKQKSSAKPIMLSYARQEAAQHAIDIKTELVRLGFSVYLDVHEIQTGTDWQDALNDAVSNCVVFVPLVTPLYGLTLWTNREVKLADVLKKRIVPINFLDHWPPICLAIQFATTQYIYWKPAETEHEITMDKFTTDIKIWPPLYIKRVSQFVANQIPDIPLPPAPPIEEIHTNGQQLIVISAHPKQKDIANQIRAELESDYTVWCSIDIKDGMDDDSAPQTPNQLPTIEEHPKSAFSDIYKEVLKKSAEKNKHRPSSLPSPEPLMDGEKKPLFRMTSQGSDILNTTYTEKLSTFQTKVSLAKAVIIVASEDYYKSRASRQQAFYCEHRKKMIIVRCDPARAPSWFSMLMASEHPITTNSTRYAEAIKGRIKRFLDPSSKNTTEDMHESKMTYLISFMKKNIPVLATCVYVIGSTKLKDSRTEEICKAIGRELARVKNVTVVTSGFYGAGDTLARAFDETRDTEKANNQIDSKSAIESSAVTHILPLKDSQKFPDMCPQNNDGSFEPMAYGKTLFLGESMTERDAVVSRLIDTCILIEGGINAAREAQEFMWNDHYVIPIISTGGAASSGVAFEPPIGVTDDDWTLLSNQDADPTAVAKAVVRIVIAIKNSIAHHAISRLQTKTRTAASKFKSKLGKSTKKKPSDLKLDTINVPLVSSGKNEPSPEKVLPVIDPLSVNDDSNQTENKGRWKKMQKLITFTRKC